MRYAVPQTTTTTCVRERTCAQATERSKRRRRSRREEAEGVGDEGDPRRCTDRRRECKLIFRKSGLTWLEGSRHRRALHGIAAATLECTTHTYGLLHSSDLLAVAERVRPQVVASP